MSSIKVTLLGTGIPDPKPDRYGASTLVQAGGQSFVFDCGRGALQHFSETGTPLKEADKLFLTHLHSDHTVGILDLWLTPWIFGRWENPFQVWGPPGVKEMMGHLEQAFEFDLRIRPVHDLLPVPGSKIAAHEIKEGVVYDQGGVKITAFEVDHRPIVPSYGYRVDYEGRSVVMGGDTRYCENLIKFAQNADVLIHNVGAARQEDLEASERYRRIMALHSKPEETGEVFARTRPRLAVYTHLVLFKVGEDEIVRRTRTSYDGPLEIGRDLMVIEIGDEVRVSQPHRTNAGPLGPEIVPPL